MKITVEPDFDETRKWYTMKILVDGDVAGWLLWIETGLIHGKYDTFCSVEQKCFAKPICETLGAAESMCEQIQEMIDAGQIR